MAYPLIPPKSQWVDANGDPMVGGSLFFFDPTTGDQKDTYPTADDADAQQNPNTNPVVLDSRGEAAIFLEDGETYRVALYDSNGALVWNLDDIAVASAPEASAVTITDAGGYYTASNVEAALQELGASTGAAIIGIADGGGYYSGTDVEAALQALGANTGAGIVGITDSGGYYASTDVEGALQELGSDVYAGGSVQILRKTSDTGRGTVSSDADPHLYSFSVSAGTYAVEGYLDWVHGGGDLKIAFGYTAAPSVRSYMAQATAEDGSTDADVDNSGVDILINGITASVDAGCWISGMVEFASGSGTGGLRWSPITATGTTTLRKGSWIRFTPIS